MTIWTFRFQPSHTIKVNITFASLITYTISTAPLTLHSATGHRHIDRLSHQLTISRHKPNSRSRSPSRACSSSFTNLDVWRNTSSQSITCFQCGKSNHYKSQCKATANHSNFSQTSRNTSIIPNCMETVDSRFFRSVTPYEKPSVVVL